VPQSSRRGQTKMASRMDSKQQGCCNKTIFSISAEQTRDKINTNDEARSRAERTREKQGTNIPVQIYGRRQMYMRPQRKNHEYSPIPLLKEKHIPRDPKK